MFKIGDFSRLTQVTVKALRHYDRLGLLKPEEIDRTSGYRYYTAAQVPRLHRILALKDLGFSLAQIGQLLDAELSPAQLHGMLLQKGEEVRDLIAAERLRLERIEERLRQVELGTRTTGYEVQLKSIPAQRVASLMAVLPDHRAIGAVYGELRAYQRRHGLHATAWTSLWHDGEYRETDIHTEATFSTVESLPPHERIRVAELPAVATMACTRHQGPIAGVGAAHEALLGWLVESGYHLVGPNRVLALHVTGPEAPDSLVEIQYPVARDAG
ncbi:MAG TPA: MerR family transcriptional regulator [Thermomicrobiales bacterium]